MMVDLVPLRVVHHLPESRRGLHSAAAQSCDESSNAFRGSVPQTEVVVERHEKTNERFLRRLMFPGDFLLLVIIRLLAILIVLLLLLKRVALHDVGGVPLLFFEFVVVFLPV